MLKKSWSPEQLVGRLKRDTKIEISHETIYRYIYKNQSTGGRLYKYLRHQNKKYTKRSSEYKTRGQIKNRVNIDKRAKIVETKKRFGDFKVDTINVNWRNIYLNSTITLSKYARATFLKDVA